MNNPQPWPPANPPTTYPPTTSGWACPRCGRCYAPFVQQCYVCMNWPTVIPYGTGAPPPNISGAVPAPNKDVSFPPDGSTR